MTKEEQTLIKAEVFATISDKTTEKEIEKTTEIINFIFKYFILLLLMIVLNVLLNYQFIPKKVLQMYFNLLLSSDNSNPLHDFLSISTWQSLISILIFFGVMFLLWFWIKKTKMRFIFPVLLGLVIGLIFGIIIQAINGFPYNVTEPSGSIINPEIPDPNTPDKTIPNNIYVLWVHEFSIWVNLFRMIFLNAILLMTVPVVFLAIARVVSKPGKDASSRRGTIITITITKCCSSVYYYIIYWDCI